MGLFCGREFLNYAPHHHFYRAHLHSAFDAEAMVRGCRAHWQLGLGRMRRRTKVWLEPVRSRPYSGMLELLRIQDRRHGETF